MTSKFEMKFALKYLQRINQCAHNLSRIELHHNVDQWVKGFALSIYDQYNIICMDSIRLSFFIPRSKNSDKFDNVWLLDAKSELTSNVN